MGRITQKNRKVDLQGKRCYVGVDVHKLTYYAAVLSEDGLSIQFSCPANPGTFISKIQNMGVEIITLTHESGEYSTRSEPRVSNLRAMSVEK